MEIKTLSDLKKLGIDKGAIVKGDNNLTTVKLLTRPKKVFAGNFVAKTSAIKNGAYKRYICEDFNLSIAGELLVSVIIKAPKRKKKK